MTKKNPSRLTPKIELTATQRKSLGLQRVTEYPKQPNAALPRIYVNSSTKGFYSGAELKQEPPRGAASMHAYSIKSRGH